MRLRPTLLTCGINPPSISSVKTFVLQIPTLPSNPNEVNLLLEHPPRARTEMFVKLSAISRVNLDPYTAPYKCGIEFYAGSTGRRKSEECERQNNKCCSHSPR
ncbi:hypothetical protein CDAR_522271 [Caerostris darwini]|uniref:Uncharacterized protein n=1 Tax=Caerostris darwini TaxID=1538125 RepID=A0AAV4SQZ9_9ARAC|nr:hypothetical protein CDAR_522271 [Caerostris darwini]